jgi:hypothetical protein
MSFINDIIKTSGNEFAGLVEDGLEGSDVKGFVDTGSICISML